MSLTLQQTTLLKIIAVLAMLIDHIGCIFFEEIEVLRVLGRPAFVLFSIILGIGIFHTRDRTAYAKRLLILAVISQPIAHLAYGAEAFNILFSFVLSIFIISMFEKFNETKKQKEFMHLLMTLTLATIFSPILEYGMIIPAIIVVTYICLKNQTQWWKWVLLTVVILVLFYLAKPLMLLGALSALVITIVVSIVEVNVERYSGKWHFYLFYPVHLGVLALINKVI
jgi:hypothetical protein